MIRFLLASAILVLVTALAAGAAEPDPAAVQRHGPAYRYPQAGWIVLHIEGEPYDRGYQHGRLLAGEIAAYLRCFAAVLSPKAPTEGWKHTRSLANALFLRRYEKEYLEEMKGIADGATAAGARFDGRPIDLLDIATLNAWPEIETLDSALEATPTGLEGMVFPHLQPREMPPPKPMHCSAFAATGPATADGQVVFGHITMFGLYPSLFYNVWLDVRPARGRRVLMQTYPGGIQSGLDYYMNDAGLLVCETTIKQTRFDIKGMSLASRIRQTLQYAGSIDEAVAILRKENNGLYTNEWLLADVKTNEIAMLELGTHRSRLWRSSKDEWFGGTRGFYWGCNNAKDLEVRLEGVASVEGRPTNVVWRPSERDKVWLRLYEKHKGKIDAGFGKEAFTTPPIAAYHSLDAKFTTTSLAKDLKTWALFGPPLGRTWQPTEEERKRYPEIRPLVSNPWTILDAGAPARVKDLRVAVDLPDKVKQTAENDSRTNDDRALPTRPAWHGTLLPATDADTWLATAFAEYERIVAQEIALREQAADGQLSPRTRERLALDLFAHRTSYLAAARQQGDVPLGKIQAEFARDDWYRIASGKGVLFLHELRQLLGDPSFKATMESFGRQHAGKPVTTSQFRAHVEKAVGKKLGAFFEAWLAETGLPRLRLAEVKVQANGNGHMVTGEIRQEGPLALARVEVTVEGARDEVTRSFAFGSETARFAIPTTEAPRRVVVGKYDGTACAQGAAFSILSHTADLEHTLIVHGTQAEAPTNREAAEALQRAILERGSNYTVPIKSDREVSEDDLKRHYLLLVGRPECNGLVERFRSAWPITFGKQSFRVGQDTYAHPNSAVIAAGENPMNRRFSVVVIAGLNAESTWRTAPLLAGRGQRGAEVLVLPNGGRPLARTLPARELTVDVK